MAAIKITVEVVDSGAIAPGIQPVLDLTNKNPFTVIVRDTDALGLSIYTLKQLLAVAAVSDIATTVAGFTPTISTAGLIDAAYTEHVIG